jgi:hypothetical protein
VSILSRFARQYNKNRRENSKILLVFSFALVDEFMLLSHIFTMVPPRKPSSSQSLTTLLLRETPLNQFLFWAHYVGLTTSTSNQPKGFRPHLSAASVNHIQASYILYWILADQGKGNRESAVNIFKSRSKRTKVWAQRFVELGEAPPISTQSASFRLYLDNPSPGNLLHVKEQLVKDSLVGSSSLPPPVSEIKNRSRQPTLKEAFKKYKSS